tara:strand:+ start:4651 stop:5160 length:510 start_codon:yes stop_codon:yes gene_type:complete
MDRKTTTFIILLGLIIASSLFQGCIEGNTPTIDTLKNRYQELEKELERLEVQKGEAEITKNQVCNDDTCSIEKIAAQDYILEINETIKTIKDKKRSLKESIDAINELQNQVKTQQKQIEEQEVEIRESQNSAQGSAAALGEIAPNIIKMKEIQNETKRKVDAGLKKING